MTTRESPELRVSSTVNARPQKRSILIVPGYLSPNRKLSIDHSVKS